MALEANINVALKLNGDTYNISLAIPSGTPTPAAPYEFNIAQTPSGGGTAVPMLTAVIGDASHYYVAVAPPPSVLSLVPGDVIDALSVVVNDGGYVPGTGFPTTGGGN